MLSRYLSTHASRWENKTVLELGAGTGVVSIALGLLNVPGVNIWSTDLEELLPLARHNVRLNGLEESVRIQELCWGKPLPGDVPHKPDLLLLADCIYVSLCSLLARA